jgi:hypothetical protein
MQKLMRQFSGGRMPKLGSGLRGMLGR